MKSSTHTQAKGSDAGGDKDSAGFTRHMPNLDGARGLAILLVMAHNFSLIDYPASHLGVAVGLALNFGWVGVQLFFVLSGFLITNILLSTRQSPNYFRSFYGRRALRIFPLYYASLLLGLLILPLLTGHTPEGSEHQIWLWTYLSNWAAPNGLEVSAYPHMWSLAVEEQFYLVWPFVVFVLSPKALLRTCVLVSVAALLVRLGLRHVTGNLEAIYQYTACRMDALAIGAAAAILYRRPELRAWLLSKRSALRVAIVVGIVIFFVGTKGAPRVGSLTQSYGYTLLALVCALLILDLARYEQGDRWTRIFSWKPLARVGAYSYSAYVIHKPLHAFVGVPLVDALGLGERTASSWLAALAYFLVVTIATLLLAMASYHAFEQPFLRLKRFFVAHGKKHGE